MIKFLIHDTVAGEERRPIYSEVPVLPTTGEEGIIYILPTGESYIYTGGSWLQTGGGGSASISDFAQGTHSGLDFEILEGGFTLNNSTVVSNAGAIISLDNNKINYVGIKSDGNFYRSNNSNFDNLFVLPLYIITTLSSAITTIVDNRKPFNLIDISSLHTQHTDYKLDDYTQTIDITGLTSINFLTGAKAITAGKNKVILTSGNATETFTITGFPSYLVELRPKSGLLINILPSSDFQTQLGMIVSLNGDINDFIIIKKNS